MTNEEKIRLVLETLGTDNVRNATKALRDLDNAIDKTASTMEGSKRKFDPQSLLILGQAVDDIQYGLRGILNNIPQLVQSFGGGAAAAGGFQIAMIAFNFALTKLGSLIEDTTPKVKPFSEQLDKLADSGKQSTAQVDALADSAKKLAENFGPSLIESFDNTVKRMGEIVATMREAQALQKEIAEENAARDKGQARIDEKGKAKDAAGLFGEFFGGMSEDDALALRDRVARDSKQRSESELIDSEMSALEGAGTWSGLKYRTLTGAQSPAQKRLEAQSRAAARESIRKRINQDGSIDKQSQKIASGLIEEALGGDPRAIQRMRDAGGFGEFETANAEDIAFQGGLTDREKAVANRNEIRSKRSIEQANNPQIPDAIRAQRQLEAEQIAAGEKSASRILPNRETKEDADLRRDLAAKAKQEAYDKTRWEMVKNATQNPERFQREAISGYNQALELGVNPMQAKAIWERNQNAQMGEIAKGFEQAGMTRDDSIESARQVMSTVTKTIERMIQTNQLSLDAYGRIQETLMNQQRQLEAQARAFQAAADGGQPQAKPPNRVRN